MSAVVGKASQSWGLKPDVSVDSEVESGSPSTFPRGYQDFEGAVSHPLHEQEGFAHLPLMLGEAVFLSTWGHKAAAGVSCCSERDSLQITLK